MTSTGWDAARVPILLALSASLVLLGPLPLLPGGRGAAEVAAQELHPTGFPYRVTVSPTVGFQGFSRLGHVEGLLLAGADGGVAGSGTRTIEADIRAQPGSQATLSAGWRISGPVVLRASTSWQSTAIEIGAFSGLPDGRDPRFFEFEEIGDVDLLTGGVSLEWRFAPESRVVRPYLGAGVGISHWSLSGMEGDPRLTEFLGEEVGIDPVSAVLPAGSLLGGVDLPLGERARLRLEVSDHVTRNPLEDRNFNFGASFEGVGRADNWVHTLAGAVGVRLRLF